MTLRLPSLTAFLALAAPALAGATPISLLHQGRVLDADGGPIEGTRDLSVQVFDAPSGDAPVWEQTVPAVPVQQGYYAVVLSGLDDLGVSLESVLATDRWVNVVIDGVSAHPEPQRLHTVPAAARAHGAALVDHTEPCLMSGGLGWDAGASTLFVCDGSAWREVRDATSPATPPGSLLTFGGSTPPEGWLVCDGSQVSRAEYPELFAAIGTRWGHGDGSSTFHLPDLRGRFLRGADLGAGRDPDASSRTPSNTGGATGDAVGTVQLDQFQTHIHEARSFQRVGSSDTISTSNTNFTNVWQNTTAPTTGRHGAETRPVNAAVLYLIKH